ncbi:hypothetical protein HKBW3S06_00917, partial [Candidatus Hakubella thermalkaliphila]
LGRMSNTPIGKAIIEGHEYRDDLKNNEID